MLDHIVSVVNTKAGRQRISQNRVLRGGSWINKPQHARAANRNYNTPDNRNRNYGFRLAGALTPKASVYGGSLNQLPDQFHESGQTIGPRHVSRLSRQSPLAKNLPWGRFSSDVQRMH